MKCNPLYPPIPNGFAEVCAQFGDIRKFIRSDGTLSPRWEEEKIVRITLPAPAVYAFDKSITISRITVHRLLVGIAGQMYQSIFEAGLWHELGPYGGGYVFRPIRGSHAISMHSFGIAWDWDPEGYPLGSTKKRHPVLAAIVRGHGLLMGEDFQGRKDSQHIQYASGT